MDVDNLNSLYKSVREIITTAKSAVRTTVNFVNVVLNWEIGKMIVDEEQGGDAKAEYGKYIIKELSEKLVEEFGNGFSETHLRYCRQFYQLFPIHHALRDKSESTENETNIVHHALRDKSHYIYQILKQELTWTHYRSLLRVENPKAREFYMKEAVENNWGTRALDRQINSLYYERLLSSQDKKPVIDEMKEKTKDLQPEDVLKDPFILEFLQLKENKNYLESELEQAIIDKLNDFLLELGKGFAFVARQKRISTESKNFYIDLVFYNYLLKCFVLIDLKTGELTHQDIGQMDMYVRLYEDKYKSADDNPTIGIILCTKKDNTVVKYSVLSENKQLFASKYQLYLPTEKELAEEIEKEIQFFEQHKK
jgi:predicted nuclease of restriction endonuclease-like (RecB) superfamily